MYDEVEDVCEPTEGQVYTFNGVTPRYNEDLAVAMSVKYRIFDPNVKVVERSAI